MKINRELLKELLKSLRKGRLHRLLRFILLSLLIYFSVLVARDLTLFYIQEKKISAVKYSGISFSFKDGCLTLSVENFSILRPTFKLNLNRARASLKLWESIKELRPHFSEISVRELQIEKSGRKKKSFLFLTPKLPFYVDRLNLGELFYRSGETTLQLKGLEVDGKRVSLESITGKSGKVTFTIPKAVGTVKGNRITLPNFSLRVNNAVYSGRLSLSKDLEKIELRGTVGLRGIKTYITFVKAGKSFSLKGKVPVTGTTVEYSVSGELGREVTISRGLVLYQGVESSFSGKLKPEELSIRGTISGKKVSIKGITATEVTGEYIVEGQYSLPILLWRLKTKELKTPFTSLKDVSVRGKFTRNTLKLQLNSDTLYLSLTRSKGSTFGKFQLKKFSTERLYAVKKLKEKYGKWIPEVVVTGKGNFSFSGKKGLNYSAKLTVEKFSFRGFQDKGSVEVAGNEKKVHYRLRLNRLDSEGEVNLTELSINASFTGKSVPIHEFDFLQKVGLEGDVTCKGQLSGSLKNPEGLFFFSSPDFKFRNVYIGKVDGKIKLSNLYLEVEGKSSEENITLKELKLHLKRPMELRLSLEAEEIPISMPIRVLKSFSVNLPVELHGVVTGNFLLSSENVKEIKKNLDVKVKLESASGRYSLTSISGKSKGVKGYINYSEGNLWILISGKNEEIKLQGNKLTGGNFSLLIENRTVTLSFNGVKYPNIQESQISGTVKTNVKTKSLEGEIKARGRILKGGISLAGEVTTSVSGKLNLITAKIKGEVTVNHPYLLTPLSFKVNGRIEEPSGIGYLAFEGEDSTLRLLAYRNKFHLTGILRGLKLKTPVGSVSVKTSLINLDLSSLNGQITVPAFEVRPKNFYRLFSISGIYVTLKNGEPEISGCRLSYTDGWIEVSGIKLEGKKISGRLNVEAGVKGLLYLKNVRRGVKYVKGNLLLKGNFSYDKELHYFITISSKGVEGKVDYILEKLTLVNLKGELIDGKLKRISAQVSAGDGQLVINGNQEELFVSVSEVPVGELNSWKSVISGNGRLKNREFSGKFNMMKTKVFFKKNGKKGKSGSSINLPVKLSVDLNFVDPVTLKSQVFQIKLLPKLKLETVNGKAVISGSFSVLKGSIDYMGKKFKVLYGTGVIENLARERGTIDLLASSYISGYYIYMNIRGSFKEPKLFLTSDPPLTREQILNLIMTGASPEQIEESSELFPAVQIAYYATASFLKPLEKQFKQTLGLESFTLEPYITKYGETVAKLSVVKKLGRKFKLIGYETTGQKPEYGGSLRYFLTDRHYLEAKYNSYYGVEFGIGVELNVR